MTKITPFLAALAFAGTGCRAAAEGDTQDAAPAPGLTHLSTICEYTSTQRHPVISRNIRRFVISSSRNGIVLEQRAPTARHHRHFTSCAVKSHKEEFNLTCTKAGEIVSQATDCEGVSIIALPHAKGDMHLFRTCRNGAAVVSSDGGIAHPAGTLCVAEPPGI